MLATVKYQVATYSGTIQVNCGENDEKEYIEAKAKRLLSERCGGLPLGYERFELLKIEA